MKNPTLTGIRLQRPLVLVTAWFCLLQPATVQADGMFIAPLGSFMYEPVQQAYLHYDSATETEQLSILPGCWGDANEFAWVVPVPTLPDVEAEDMDLFRDLDRLTQAVYRDREDEWGCDRFSQDYDVMAAPTGRVDVIESVLVGYYNTLVIAADDASVLTDSLTAWGFLHTENLVAATEALAHYVKKSWYFVAMKVDSTALADLYAKRAPYIYYGGGLDPVRLTFSSPEIVYPMKISAFSADQNTSVHLYVNSDHRLTFTGAATWFASRITQSELNQLGNCPTLAGRLQDGDFLTKLNRAYTPAQMTEDVILTRAANDNEYQLIQYSGLPWTLMVLLAPAGIWAIYRRTKQRVGQG